MSKPNETVKITIDNRPLKVETGLTILQAAEQNDIYIPTLCAHKELTPFGGCRLCIVEVEGMRSLPGRRRAGPTACPRNPLASGSSSQAWLPDTSELSTRSRRPSGAPGTQLGGGQVAAGTAANAASRWHRVTIIVTQAYCAPADLPSGAHVVL